jgi:ABC-type sugar transport system ATPase subunit
MVFELNEVLTEGAARTLSMMAEEGRMTCLTGGTAELRSRWLRVMLGFEPTLTGFVSIDGEPLTASAAPTLRQLMAYAPACLTSEGEVVVYEAPSVQDVFNLETNRECPISNGILSEEMRRVGADADDVRTRLIAVAVLLNRPILLIDNPPAAAALYLARQARQGKMVIVCSQESKVLEVADQIVEL